MNLLLAQSQGGICYCGIYLQANQGYNNKLTRKSMIKYETEYMRETFRGRQARRNPMGPDSGHFFVFIDRAQVGLGLI